MASLRKDPRGKSPFWYACITIPGKGQTQRSTKVRASERLRSEAMSLAEKWERQANQLAPMIRIENRDAILESFISVTQQAVKGELTEATARDVLDQILTASGQGVIKRESVREFATNWLNARTVQLVETSRVAYRHALDLFLNHLGSHADKSLASVTTRQIETFKSSRVASGLSAKTVDRDLKVMRSMFRAAVNQNQIRFDPSQAVTLTSRKGKTKTQRVTREIFRSEELDAIVKETKGEWLTATLIGRYTGARLGDCVMMRWSSVNLVEDVLRYTDKKTGKDYAIPLHHRLQEHLISIADNDEADARLCPSLAGKETGGCNGLSAQFKKIMKRAGVDSMITETKALQEVEGKKRTLSRRSFHCLRHTYNTELANAEVPQEVRRKMIGHSSDEVNDIYTKLDFKVFRAAVNKLV